MTDSPAVPTPEPTPKKAAKTPAVDVPVPAPLSPEEQAVFDGAVRNYVPNPQPKLSPEDQENQRLAALKAAKDKADLEAALAVVESLKKDK